MEYFQLQNELQTLESNQQLFKLTNTTTGGGLEILSLPPYKTSSSSSSSWKMFHGSTGDFYRTQFLSSSRPDYDFYSGFSDAEYYSTNLKQERENRCVSSNSRDGFFEGSVDLQHQQISLDHHGFLGTAANFHQTHFELKNSKYLNPTQEVLLEFCNLGSNQTNPSKHKSLQINQWNDETTRSSCSSRKQSDLNSLDLEELQKRQSKLLSMLKEVDQRYRLYCDQIRAVVSSFETVLGEGAATAYSTPASKAISRHFRFLRDGIMSQIKEIKEAMGEKDPLGLTTAERVINKIPRLRLLDQSLRQQKSYQQINMMQERQPWRPQRGLPERSVTVLRAWLFEHFLHPYPSDVDKLILARQAGLSRSQVSNWFINARVRLWKPMVEEMYLEETKEQQLHNNMMMASTAADGEATEATLEDQRATRVNQNDHEKPAPNHNQFVLLDSHSCADISSIINITDKGDHHPEHYERHHHHQQQSAVLLSRSPEMSINGSYGRRVTDLDLSSNYSHHHHHHDKQAMLSYTNEDIHQNYRNGVSLTLGLQQHGGGALNLSFSPAATGPQQPSFLLPKDHIVLEDCQPVQYSV